MRALSAKERRQADAETRAMKSQVQKLDSQLNKLHVQLTTLDAKLADPALYVGGRSPKVADLERQQREMRKLIASTEQEWMALAEKVEQVTEA